MNPRRRCPGVVALVGVAGAVLISSCGQPESLALNPFDYMDPVPCTATGTETVSGTAPSSVGASYRVQSVVDGDTIRIDCDGESTRVRLIGVDTPETVKDGTPVECGGPEASAFLRSKVEGQEVFLFGDTAQGERDCYGRLLAYVFTTDALLESVNETILAQGYGRDADYGKGYIYRDTFQARSLQARNNAEGVWACPD